jgi:hypothetical protein
LYGFLEPLVIFSHFPGTNNHLSQVEASVKGNKYLPKDLIGGKCEAVCCTGKLNVVESIRQNIARL